MGDLPPAGREAVHGLHSQFKYLGWHRADLPFFFLPAPPIIFPYSENFFHFCRLFKNFVDF